MKSLIVQYVENLKERDELDVLLPKLLSGLGFHVLTYPSRGTRQSGVDVAAVGPDEIDGGKNKLFLFVIKSGTLTRSTWDNGPQSVRASLNEVIDAYIPTKISNEYLHLDIVICLCVSGSVHEAVTTQWVNYQNKNTTEKISFSEWNGNKIASLLTKGILREELLPEDFRALFQKSIALLDNPEESLPYFSKLIHSMADVANDVDAIMFRLQQMYICLPAYP